MSNELTLGGNTVYLPAVAFPFKRGVLIQGISTVDIESFSAFGQARWQVSEQLELAGGVRWTNEKRGLEVFDRLTNARTVLARDSDRISSKNWSPEFTVAYTPTDTFTLFAAFKQAYKSGSFNINVPGNQNENKSFGDEKAQGGEIGIKSRLLDRSLSLDIAGYYYKYTGLQTGVNAPSQGGLPEFRTLNAGSARVYGIDFETKFRPPSIDGLTLNLAINWNKSKFLELDGVPCWGGQRDIDGCNKIFVPFAQLPAAQQAQFPNGRFTAQNLAGLPLVRAPEWQINFGLDFDMPVGDNMTLGFGIDNQYRSRYLTALGLNRSDYFQPGYLKTDIGLTLNGPEDRWSLGLVANNVQNKIVRGFCSNTSSMTAVTLLAAKSGAFSTDPQPRNVAGVDEVGCSTSGGRSIWIRAGFKL